MLTKAPTSTSPPGDLTAEQTSQPDQTITERPAPAELERMIALTAYYIAERRGFAPGHELDDWLAAEAQVFDMLAASRQD